MHVPRPLIVGLVALTAACSTPPEPAPAPTSELVDALPSQPPAGLTPLGNADITSKTERPAPPAQLTVTKIRVGHHQGFDRVVFELEGAGQPGWFVDYADHPVQQASGLPVDFDGATALNMNIDGIAYPFDMDVTETAPDFVKGPDEGNITQVQATGTFEGRAQYIVGLRQKVPYSVQVIDEPTRLVIDLVC